MERQDGFSNSIDHNTVLVDYVHEGGQRLRADSVPDLQCLLPFWRAFSAEQTVSGPRFHPGPLLDPVRDVA